MASPGQVTAIQAVKTPGQFVHLQIGECENFNLGLSPVKISQGLDLLETWRGHPVQAGLVCMDGASRGSALCFAYSCNLMAEFASL